MARFITSLELRNYKSVGSANLKFSNLTLLSGPNGSGKSNILDAFNFVGTSLFVSLENAIRERGGFGEIRRRSTVETSNDATITCNLRLGRGSSARYSLRLSSDSARSYYVKDESCHIYSDGGRTLVDFFTLRDGTLVESSQQSAGKIRSDRLYLVAAGANEAFEPVFDVLSRIVVYTLDPVDMKTPQYHDPGEFLTSFGSNIASVIDRLKKNHPEAWATVLDYLQTIIPAIVDVETVSVGSRSDLEFLLRSGGGELRFPSLNVSDGTVRALGLLLALFQETESKVDDVSLVCLEEPEATLHPGAMNVLVSAMIEAAAGKRQVVASTHSPDLLDRKDIKASSLIAVHMVDGETKASGLDTTSTSVIRDRLYSAGQLLRMGQLK